MSKSIKARLFFMGRDQGIVDVNPNGLLGRFLRGNFYLGVKKLDAFKRDLEKIPGVKVDVNVKVDHPRKLGMKEAADE